MGHKKRNKNDVLKFSTSDSLPSSAPGPLVARLLHRLPHVGATIPNERSQKKMSKMKAVWGSLGLGVAAMLSGCAVESAREFSDESVMSIADEDVRESEAALTCSQAQWQDPMRAALAVSMGREIGRIDALKDLTKGDRVYLTQDAKNRCNSRGFGNCTNTQAILDLQLSTVNTYINQNIFSATSFREDLRASFDRQSSHEANLRMNSPSRVPGEYALTQVGTFTMAGACGVHFDFTATGTNVTNLKERLVFFGGGQNPYIAFTYNATTGNVAIDPSGTMNGDGSTSSGSTIVTCSSTNMALKDKPCSCGGKTGKLRPAPWNLSTLYCAT
jgi:hypothetical protein